jgi:hypothetical protein
MRIGLSTRTVAGISAPVSAFASAAASAAADFLYRCSRLRLRFELSRGGLHCLREEFAVAKQPAGRYTVLRRERLQKKK